MESSERGLGVSTAGDAIVELMTGALGRGLGRASAAAKAWYVANGDRERAHTTGVWLQKSGRVGVDPVLVVALDSNLLAYELATNKDLYLARLAFRGVEVSDIRFTVGKRDTKGGAAGVLRAMRKGVPQTYGDELPPLSATEEESVARATSDLPDGLRESVSRAMSASLRRSKASKG